MPVKFDVVATTGKYTDRSTGQERNQYMKIGVILQREDGSFLLKLESVPVGWNGWANLMPPREGKQQAPQQQPQQRPQKPPTDEFVDDVPW